MAYNARMSQSEPGAGLAQLHAERERLISHFSERFSVGVIEVEEFERRLGELHRSTSLVELQRQAPGLLVSPGAESLAIRPAAALIPAEQAPSQKQVLAVFGSTERRGTWTGPRRLKVSAVFGNVTLDFRDARLPAGTVDIEVNAAFGNVEILVPPSLAVETEGAGVFGNFEHMERAPAIRKPDAPLLHIKCIAVFGNIEISTRLAQDKQDQLALRRR